MAICALLTGRRLGDIVRLQWGDVSFNTSTVVVRQSKTVRSRGVPLHRDLAPMLEAIGESREGAVFRRASGRPWTVQEASRRFHAVVVAAKIDDFRFHDLRHAYATRVRSKGGGIDEVAKLLGHTSLAVTQRSAHLEDARLHRLVASLDSPTNATLRLVPRGASAP